MPLSDSLCIVKETQNNLEKTQGHIEYLVNEKFAYVSP